MKPKLNLSVDSEVGADKRLGRHPVQDHSGIQGLIDHITEHGYVVIPSAFSSEEIEKAKAEVRRLASAPRTGGGGHR